MLLESLLPYANKIFNTWIEKYLPLTNQILLIPKKEEHRAKWQKYDDAMAEKEKNRSEILTGLARLASHYKDTPDEGYASAAATHLKAKFDDVQALEDRLQKMKIKRDQAHQCEEKFFSIPHTIFELYLDKNIRTDDGIKIDTENLHHAQKECLKDIHRIITNTTAKDVSDLTTEKILSFYLKILSVLKYALFEKANVKIDYKAIGKWLKIGVWLLDKTNHFTKKDNKRYRDNIWSYTHAENIRCTRILTASLYAHLAFHLVITPSPLSDFDLLLAENFLKDAIDLAEGITPFTVVKALKYCVQTKLALEREHIDEFLSKCEQIEKIVPHNTYYHPFFIILKCAGEYFEKKDPTKAVFYYEKGLNQFALCEIDHDTLLIKDHASHMRQYCEAQRKEQETQLISTLKKAFNGALIKIDKNKLCIFIPLLQLPKNPREIGYIRIMKIWNNEPYKGINQVGITFTCNSKNAAKNIISDIRSILNSTQEKSFYIPPITPDTSVCLSNNNVPFSMEKEAVQQEKRASPPPFHKSKIKTRKGSCSIVRTAESEPIRSSSASLKARDMGFIFPDSNFNPPVTPVYCSKAAQAKKRPQILVRWEEVSGINTNTKNFF